MSHQWHERPEGGHPWVITGSVWLVRHVGRAIARLLLVPVALYFFLRRGPERRASRAFLTRVFGRPARWSEVLRHVYSYSATILDRAFLLSESFRRFDVRVSGLDELHAQVDRGRGVLLLGAHIGSFEVLRVLGEQRPEVRICVVMDRQQTPTLTAAMHALNPVIAANVIDAANADASALALAIHDAAQSGALIGLLGDRARSGEAVQEVEFLGARAQLPVAPYLLAGLLHLPVVLAFGLYRGGNRYDVYFETFADELQLPRAERAGRLAECAQRFAARLEHYVRLDPYNWFNLYDFWHRRADSGAARREPAAAVRADA